MSVFRKLLGGFILIFIGIPLLMAISWATGVTGAVVSKDFVGTVVTDIVDQVPNLVDEMFDAAKDPEAVKDPEVRVWVDAAAKVKKTPSELLKEIGFYDWLEKDLGGSLEIMGQMIQGEREPDSVVLSFRRLKEAFAHPSFREYVAAVLAQLPACTPEDFKAWEEAGRRKDKNHDLPPCNPGEGIVDMAVSTVIAELDEVPDEETIMRKSEIPSGFNAARTVNAVMWFLFLIPAIVILLGAAIAGKGRAGFLLWAGATTLAGGLVTLMISGIIGEVMLAAMQMDPSHWNWEQHGRFWTTEPGRLVAGRVADIVSLVVEHIFDPVTTIALVVSGVGAVLLVLGFLAPGPKDT